jgi:RNA polymerase sigma factor (sigma-70 family)
MNRGTRGLDVRSITTLFGGGSVTGMTDGQLLEQFLTRKDEVAAAAFSALVSHHGPMVWNVCNGVLSDAHAAEDAFQATFLILVRKAGSIRQRETLAPWLYGVARRVAVRARASAARRRVHESQGAEMIEAAAAPELSHREELEALHEEVDRLPEKCRTAVVLCHLDGRTHAEAARLLKCPAGTVSVRVSRARELLRVRLTRRGLALSVATGLTLGPEAARAAIPAGLAASTVKAAMCVAAGTGITAGIVPAAVAQLTEGVQRTMSASALPIAAASIVVAGFVASGFALLAMSGPSGRGNRGEDVVSAPRQGGRTQDEPAASPQAAAPAKTEDEQKARRRTMDNFKTLGLALNGFALTRKPPRYPPAAISKDGKPLLSWRVAILPYIDQKALHDKFHLDEPWDSPHNKALLEPMPEVYAPVIHKAEPKGSTYYQALVGPGAAFEGDEGTKIQDFTDGVSWTILVVEAAKAVPWTKPEDVPFDPSQPLPKLGGQYEEGFHVVCADGGGLFLSKTIDRETFLFLATRNGGEVISAEKMDKYRIMTPRP